MQGRKFDLNEISIFTHLPDKVLAEISAVIETETLEQGEIIFNQGDQGNKLIIVDQGSISIFAPDPGNESPEPIRIFEMGEVLGEMALIDDQPRSLSARAETKATILTLSKNNFQNLLNDYPEMNKAVMCSLNDRIRYTTEFLSEVRKWVGNIAKGDYKFNQGDQGYNEKSLAQLAEEFAYMAGEVQKREDELKNELNQFHFIIDEAKRKQEVEDIVHSGFFKDLEKAVANKKKRRQASD